MAQVTELITKFSFQGSESPLNKYNASLGKSIGILAGFGAAIVGTSALISKWASSIIEAEQPLINLAAKTGLAVERLQELDYIANVNNSSSEAMASSIEGLSTKIGEAAQKGSEEFSRLGISVRDANGQVKSTDRVLFEIGNRFKALGLSLNEQTAFAEALGIDATLLQTMRLTSKEISGLSQKARDLGILNEKQIKDAQEYNDSLTTLRFGMSGIQRLIAVGLAPELKDLSDKFTNLLIENKDWIVNGITATIKLLNQFVDLIGRVWPILAVGVGVFTALKVATIGWGAVLAVVFSPVVLFTALIVGLILVFDDLIAAFNGEKSLIADWFKSAFGVDIRPILQASWAIFKETAMATFSILGDIIHGRFKDAFMKIIKSIADMFKSIGKIIPDWVKDIFGDDKKEIKVDTRVTTPDFDPNDIPQMPSSRMGSVNNNRRVEMNVTQQIRTTDPVKAGNVAADSLQDQMANAQYQANRGGF